MIKLFTIGFTKTTAESFFSRLSEAGVRKVVDVRLNNRSQLAGFAKRKDLPFFLQSLCGAGYEHRPELAPTQEILDQFKKRKGDWDDYVRQFVPLLEEREIATAIPKEAVDHACLLCSEDKPHHCHRRLVAEYLQERWGGVEIVHL